MDAARFQQATGVSRETLTRLETYAALLAKWQRRINLVGASTLADLWRRHMQDSAQLLPLLPPSATTLVDLGSGAGFPGMVLAILGVPDVHLIESDTRKAVFLGEVSRATATRVTLHARRVEEVPPVAADVVTARALAPLPELIQMARRFSGESCVWLFPKGRDVDRELTLVPETPTLRIEKVPSLTDPGGTILRVQRISRA